jgi:RNA polymerase sigma-70 factor, ECF subfamily
MSTSQVTAQTALPDLLRASRAASTGAERLSIVDHTEPTAPAGPVSREEPRVMALLEAARRGEQEAFGELVALHESVVYRTALAALGRAEDAEDAAQEAFVVAWKKLRAFRGDSTFRTWLLTIVWRKALDRRRARRLWWLRTQRADDGVDDVVENLDGGGISPEAQTIARELRRRIKAEIRRLSPKFKDVMLLAASGEHSYDDIASMLRIPVGTVKWRVSEARRILKARLGREV